MLDVFFTVDVEVWCDGWTDIDERFPAAFQRYVYGSTPRGDFGLPYQLKVLNEHGLKGVFFVEPLFSARFGTQPLSEIVGLIDQAGQEVQLHLHTEWVDEAHESLLDDGISVKRQHLMQFSLADQTRLISTGRALLEAAGAAKPDAFRAGSFGFNLDTLKALAALGMPVDSSYNACHFGPASGVAPGQLLTDHACVAGVSEYPMTVFDDGLRGLRHAQLTACSFQELTGLLWQALERGQSGFVLLSHNFELLNPAKTRADEVVVRRMNQLCRFLDRHRDVFNVRGFAGHRPAPDATPQPSPLRSARWKTGLRMAEQAYRKIYQ